MLNLTLDLLRASCGPTFRFTDSVASSHWDGRAKGGSFMDSRLRCVGSPVKAAPLPGTRSALAAVAGLL